MEIDAPQRGAPTAQREARRMSPQARRESFLDAASRVLERRALAELSFELVADEAGVSKTLPYRYFDSPTEMAVELFDRIVGGVDQRIGAVLVSDDPFDDRIAGTIHAWCDVIEANGRVLQTLLEGKAVAVIRPLVQERDAADVRRWAVAIEGEYDIDHDDALFVATACTSAGTAVLERWANEGQSRDEIITRFVRTVHAMAVEFARS